MAGFQLNHVALSGNLVRDPELRTTPTGATVCDLRIAANERIKDGENWTDRPMYFSVTIWRGTGEWVARNLHKGDAIAVTGRLQWREWEKDGQKREAVSIVADAIMPRTATTTSPPRENPDIRQAHSDIPADTTGLPEPTPVYGDPDDDDVPFAHDASYFEWEPWHAHENR